MAKSQQYNKELYPEDFSQDEIINYDTLMAQAKLLYPLYEEFVLKIGITSYIRKERGEVYQSSKEEIKAIKDEYLKSKNQKIYETFSNVNIENEVLQTESKETNIS
jgi:hypothetical protein